MANSRSGFPVDSPLQNKALVQCLLYCEARQPNQPRGTNAYTAGGPLCVTVCCWWRMYNAQKKKRNWKTKNSDQVKTLFSLNQLIHLKCPPNNKILKKL